MPAKPGHAVDHPHSMCRFRRNVPQDHAGSQRPLAGGEADYIAYSR